MLCACNSRRCSPAWVTFDLPVTDDPNAFWSALAHYYLQLMTALEADPQLSALLRGLDRGGDDASDAAAPAGNGTGGVAVDGPSPH